MNTGAILQQWPEGLSDLYSGTSVRPASPEFPLVLPFRPKVRPPERFLLGRLLDARLRVTDPIDVRVIRENRDVILEAIEINEFGFGANLSEALTDLQAAIAELYFTLERNENQLGPEPERIWLTLRAKIVRRP